MFHMKHCKGGERKEVIIFITSFLLMKLSTYLKKFKKFTKQSINWRGQLKSENLEKFAVNPRSYDKLLSYVKSAYYNYTYHNPFTLENEKRTLFASGEEYRQMSRYDRGRQAVALREFLKNPNSITGLQKAADRLQFIDYIAQKKVDNELEKTKETVKPTSFEGREMRVKQYLSHQNLSPHSFFKKQYIDTFLNMVNRYGTDKKIYSEAKELLNKMSPTQLYKLQNSGLDFTDIAVWYSSTSVNLDMRMIDELTQYIIDNKGRY
nr:MAG TPA: hypothetical protein [Caudoviricetes sp.]